MNRNSTTTQRVTKRAKPAAPAALPYPNYEDFPEKLFWLCVYFRDLTELEALEALTLEMHRRHRPQPLLFALSGAKSHQKSEIKLPLGYVIEGGLLPFAHATTTIFSTVGGLQ
jgi:hypothetical protein